MKKIYLWGLSFVFLIFSALFYYYFQISQKQIELEKNIKSVPIVEESDFKNSYAYDSVFGETKTKEKRQFKEENANKIAKTISQKENVNIVSISILPVSELPVASLGFLGNKIIFTQSSDGLSFSKNKPDDKSQKLAQNSLKDVISADYSDNHILRKTFNENFEYKINLEKINAPNIDYEINANVLDCSFSGNDLICLEKEGDKYSITETKIEQIGDEEKISKKTLYITHLKYINFYKKGDYLFLVQYPNQLKESVLLKVDLKSGKVLIVKKAYGLDAVLSNDGKKAYLSYYNGKELVNSIIDTANKEEKYLDLKTFARKCAFVKDKAAICAVPNTNIDLNDYLKGKIQSNDKFYVIDLDSMISIELAEEQKLPEVVDAEKITAKIIGNEFKILFINRINKKAWSIIIKYDSNKNDENGSGDNINSDI